jgi:MFS family permease
MWRSPGFVLSIACAVLALNMGVRGGFGLFLLPISHEYGWPVEVFSLAMAIQALVWGITQPVAGALAGRFGTLRVVVASALAYAGGVLMMAFAATPALMYLASFVVGAAISGTAFGVVFGPVAQVTPVEKRSAALGIATAGASFGLFAGPILTERFIAWFGWVGALYALAGLVALTAPMAPLLAGGRAPAAGAASAPQPLKAALAEAGASGICAPGSSSAASTSPSSPPTCRPSSPPAAWRRPWADGRWRWWGCSTSSAATAPASWAASGARNTCWP